MKAKVKDLGHKAKANDLTYQGKELDFSLGSRPRPRTNVTGSCNLDLDPMTFIYELDPYSLEIYRIYKYELSESRFSKVIV